MKFALTATLSLALIATNNTLATEAQAQEGARVRRRTTTSSVQAGGLVEERLHDPKSELLVAAELTRSSTTWSSSYTAAELKLFQERFKKTSLGGLIAGRAAAAAASSSSSGTAAAAAAAAAAEGSSTSKGNKSANTGGICADRLDMVKVAVDDLLEYWLQLDSSDVPDEDITAA